LIKKVTLHQAWEGEADCRNCTLRESALFSSLTEDDFSIVHDQVEQVTMNPGEILYKIADPGYHLFTVRSGLVKLVHYLPDGTQRIVRLAFSTDVIGLEMMVGQYYLHEVVALRTTELCRYPIAAVNRMCETNSDLHNDLISRWQRALSEAEASLVLLSTGTAKRRMANLMLRLLDGEGSSECILFSREDIGSILNMTVETASRTISEFKRQGIMKEIRNNHFDLDIPAMEIIAKS
jgi:CRP/FNR family transcriptional regulator, anaerobic regulatory protein